MTDDSRFIMHFYVFTIAPLPGVIVKPTLNLLTDSISLLRRISFEYLNLAEWPDLSEVFPVHIVIKYKGDKEDTDQNQRPRSHHEE